MTHCDMTHDAPGVLPQVLMFGTALLVMLMVTSATIMLLGLFF